MNSFMNPYYDCTPSEQVTEAVRARLLSIRLTFASRAFFSPASSALASMPTTQRSVFGCKCTVVILLISFFGVASKSWSLQSASFVPPASPTSKRSGRTFPSAHSIPVRPATHLLAKRKAAPAAAKKIQVKMLKYIEGTGHIGEVVMVTPAFFSNKLRPTSSAVVVSDEEVAMAIADANALERETNAHAEALKERMEDLALKLKRKAGPDGQLFGGIGPKCIMDELHTLLADDFLSHKNVKIAGMTYGDGKDLRGDIKHIGEFGATLSLTKEISVLFKIVVDPVS